MDPRVNSEERGFTKGLREGGASCRAIAQITGRGKSTVARIVSPKKLKASKPKEAGRRSMLSDRETRLIVRVANVCEYTAAQLNKRSGTKASVRTIQRVLSRVDWLVYAKMKRTLALTTAHKAHRLRWAKAVLLRPGSLKMTIFLDEMKFNLDAPDGFKYYWRDLRQAPRGYVCRQNGGGLVMVWGAFCWEGKSQLAVLIEKQKSKHYIHTVSVFLLTFAHLHHGVEFVFQQDNAPIHASNKTKDFLEEMHIDVFKWPARSPDLNPIENVWSIMANIVCANGKQYNSVADLTEAIQDAWKHTSIKTLRALIDSMPARCFQVLECHGSKISY